MPLSVPTGLNVVENPSLTSIVISTLGTPATAVPVINATAAAIRPVCGRLQVLSNMFITFLQQ